MSISRAVLEEIFRAYVDKAKDPYLSSMKVLPTNVYDDLIDDFINSATLEVRNKSLHLTFNMVAFAERVKGAVRSEVLMDEVGMLLQYGASKTVINEVTGVHQRKIILRRKVMKPGSASLGRPRIFDPCERNLIASVWGKIEGFKSIRLIRTHLYTDLPINDIWQVVRELDRSSIKKNDTHADQHH